MAKLKILYDSEEEIDQIISMVEKHIDMKDDTENLKQNIQLIIQNAFEEGRQFQKQISHNLSRDSLLHKSER